MACAYRSLLTAAYPLYPRPLGSDHLGRRIDNVRVAVFLDDRAEMDKGPNARSTASGYAGNPSVLIWTTGVYPPTPKACASLACGLGNTSRPATSIIKRRALSAERLPTRNVGINGSLGSTPPKHRHFRALCTFLCSASRGTTTSKPVMVHLPFRYNGPHGREAAKLRMDRHCVPRHRRGLLGGRSVVGFRLTLAGDPILCCRNRSLAVAEAIGTDGREPVQSAADHVQAACLAIAKG
jgi:hypothetical protein